MLCHNVFGILNEYLFTHRAYLINQRNKKGEPFSELLFENKKTNKKGEPVIG
jgi:hypothetical protein